jgi:TolB-like protein
MGFYQAQPPVIPPDRSIAVLPFKNLNPDKADAFFTTAVQYGMAANLAHMPSFKVVGPEKTAGYASKDVDYPTVGRKLGVRYLLEGSVLHDGELAHVAIRLIDLNNLARPLTSQYDVPINEALAPQNEKIHAPETVHDPASLLAFLLPVQTGGLGSMALGVGASVPFTEYEAESGALAGGSTVISLTSPPTPDCSTPQLEASGRAFVQLAGKDQSVTWTNNTDKSFTAINLRYSIPDAPNGGGINETLDLYVNGTFRQALHLTSAQTWVYQAAVQDNGMAQVPAPGLSPHVFFDEMHAWVQGEPIAPGSTIMLKQGSSNLAAFYWIDLIDLESPPAPLSKPPDFLSITDFGAHPDDSNFDNTPAIRSCFTAAESQEKGVWIPPGTFYLTVPQDNLHAKGITIEGAGPWYSTIYHLVSFPSGYVSDIIFGSSCTIRNLAFDSNADSSEPSRGSSTAVNMGGSGWVLDNIWSQHEGLVWASAQAGTVENCRINNAWGAGIAIFNGGPDAKAGDTLNIQNNFCRGNGGDGISIESSSASAPYHSPRIANNTSVCTFLGANLRVGGGSEITVENNLLRDPVTDANMIIGLAPPKDEDANLTSAIVQGNLLVRGGAFKFRSLPTASLIIGGDTTQTGFQPTKVSNIDVLSNTISDSLFSGMFFVSWNFGNCSVWRWAWSMGRKSDQGMSSRPSARIDDPRMPYFVSSDCSDKL